MPDEPVAGVERYLCNVPVSRISQFTNKRFEKGGGRENVTGCSRKRGERNGFLVRTDEMNKGEDIK